MYYSDVIMVGCMFDMVDQNKHNVDHNRLGSGLALVSFARVDLLNVACVGVCLCESETNPNCLCGSEHKIGHTVCYLCYTLTVTE